MEAVVYSDDVSVAAVRLYTRSERLLDVAPIWTKRRQTSQPNIVRLPTAPRLMIQRYFSRSTPKISRSATDIRRGRSHSIRSMIEKRAGATGFGVSPIKYSSVSFDQTHAPVSHHFATSAMGRQRTPPLAGSSRHQIRERHPCDRRGAQEPLVERAPFPGEQAELLFGFHAFRDHVEAE